ARAGRQEPAALFAALFGGGGALRIGQSARPAIGRDHRDEIGKLLRLESEELRAGLRGLYRAQTSALSGQSQGATGALQATHAGHPLLARHSHTPSDPVAVLAASGRACASTDVR